MSLRYIKAAPENGTPQTLPYALGHLGIIVHIWTQNIPYKCGTRQWQRNRYQNIAMVLLRTTEKRLE